jgi:hypothetical protein
MAGMRVISTVCGEPRTHRGNSRKAEQNRHHVLNQAKVTPRGGSHRPRNQLGAPRRYAAAGDDNGEETRAGSRTLSNEAPRAARWPVPQHVAAIVEDGGSRRVPNQAFLCHKSSIAATTDWARSAAPCGGHAAHRMPG